MAIESSVNNKGRSTMWGIRWRYLLLGLLSLWCFVPVAHAEDASNALVIYDFETDTQEWAIPEWETQSADYSAQQVSQAADFASSGKSSLQVMVDFPGGKWIGAYVERMMYVTDWTPFSGIAADVYVPYNAPKGLKARFILTVGDKWQWTEMNRGLSLTPEQWTTISANLMPGSQDWKFFPDDAFRKDIRKLGIRIEADNLTYRGPVYIDHVRLIKLQQ